MIYGEKDKVDKLKDNKGHTVKTIKKVKDIPVDGKNIELYVEDSTPDKSLKKMDLFEKGDEDNASNR